VGVVTRRLTDVLALGDPEVSAAVRFIREHACEGIAIKDLLEEIPLSRRVLGMGAFASCWGARRTMRLRACASSGRSCSAKRGYH
jgi:hypothetical protein